MTIIYLRSVRLSTPRHDMVEVQLEASQGHCLLWIKFPDNALRLVAWYNWPADGIEAAVSLMTRLREGNVDIESLGLAEKAEVNTWEETT